MSSVKERYYVEEYIDGGWGCPTLDIMGCSTFDELAECMEIIKNAPKSKKARKK